MPEGSFTEAQARPRNKEAQRARDWYYANKDRALVLQKERYNNKREEILAAAKARYLANPEIYRAAAKAYQVAHPEKWRVSQKAYRAANPSKLTVKNSRRRAKKLRATPPWANDFFIEEIYDLARLRTKLTGIEWHVDHQVPLNHPLVQGLHVEFNLQVIPKRANLSKGNHFWPDMP